MLDSVGSARKKSFCSLCESRMTAWTASDHPDGPQVQSAPARQVKSGIAATFTRRRRRRPCGAAGGSALKSGLNPRPPPPPPTEEIFLRPTDALQDQVSSPRPPILLIQSLLLWNYGRRDLFFSFFFPFFPSVFFPFPFPSRGGVHSCLP